jgi:hypothetical protein
MDSESSELPCLKFLIIGDFDLCLEIKGALLIELGSALGVVCVGSFVLLLM